MTGEIAERAEAIAHIDAGHVTLAIAKLRQLLDDSAGEDHDVRLLLAWALLRAGRDREAGQAAESVARYDGLEAPNRALAAAVLGHAGIVAGDSHAISLLDDALRLEGGAGLASTLAWGALAVRRYWVGDLPGAVSAARGAVEASATAPRVEREDAKTVLAAMLMHSDSFDESAALLISAPHDQLVSVPPVSRSLRERVLGALHFHAGRWDQAIPLLDSRRDIAERIEIPDHDRALATGLLVVLLVHRDRLDEADRVVATGVPLMASGQGVLLLWGAALLAEARGQASTAADLCDRLAAKVDDLACPVRYRLFAPDLIRLRLDAGDRVLPTLVANALERVADASGVPSIVAAALLSRGLIEDDPDLLQRASELFATSPRVFDHAVALDAYGAALSTAAPEAAVTVDRRVRELYASLGAIRDVRRLDSRLRSRGVSGGRPLRDTPLGGVIDRLSPTEATVASLIAKGLTNVEIARRLYVSPRTVETHVAHVFEKLGVKRRAAIAGLLVDAHRE